MDNALKDIGNVVISLTMALFAFMLVFLDLFEKAASRRIELRNVDALVEEILRRRMKRVEIWRLICAMIASVFFVAGACLVIIGLILGGV